MSLRVAKVSFQVFVALGCVCLIQRPAAGAPPLAADELQQLDTHCADKSQRKELAEMVERDVSQRLRAANRQSSAEWHKIASLTEWEAYRSEKLKKLRGSLGAWTRREDGSPDQPPLVHETGKVSGDGFEIVNLVFGRPPGLWVTGNLYRPTKMPDSAPGIVISHSHHSPKTQSELQDMGMTWARQGCLVLAIDHLGHGERRQHPFRDAADYGEKFPVSRQDYYFRYDTSLQLYLAGESLVGALAGDLMRAVDVLLMQPHIDRQRILLLGGVAGGGDPAAVAGALDPRITAVGPFNFGGPQPETRYPLPEDAEDWFDYAGGGSWESTRNLNRSAGDGFLPWVIVGGIAPRRLIYGHEFSWDGARDPVWKRFEKIYAWYEASDRLAVAHGAGTLRGEPPAATHCNSIGPPHREMIYPALARWFNLPAPPIKEYRERHDAKDLMCLTPALAKELEFKLAHVAARELGSAQIAKARSEYARSSGRGERREKLRQAWSQVLGPIEPVADVRAIERSVDEKDERVERIVLGGQRKIKLPLLLLRPTGQAAPIVVGISQAGKGKFVGARATEIAELLSKGIAVCLVDVRGTGETNSGDDNRGRTGSDASLAASELMLGGTMLGAQLGDLRTALQYLRGRKDLDARRIVLWGESFAPENGPDRKLAVPHGIDGRPLGSEPLGGLLAMLGALYDDQIHTVYCGGTLTSYLSALDSPFVYLPHDVVVPGVLATGDLDELAAGLAPTSLAVVGAVDGSNRRTSAAQVSNTWATAAETYKKQNASAGLVISEGRNDRDVAKWIAEQLGK